MRRVLATLRKLFNVDKVAENSPVAVAKYFCVNSSKSLLIPRLAQQETDVRRRRRPTVKQVSKVPITLSNCCHPEQNINFFIEK